MSLDRLRNHFRTYDRGVYRVMAGGLCAPSEARLEDLEKSLDFRLPEEFREFTLSPLGGLYIEVLEDLWPRPVAGAEPSLRDQFGLKIFGLSIPIPDWLDLREEILRLPPEEGDLVPFMAPTGTDDRYCFDLDGQIVLWSAAGGRRQVIPLSFYQLVLQELEELERRRATLKSQSAPRRGKRQAKRTSNQDH